MPKFNVYYNGQSAVAATVEVETSAAAACWAFRQLGFRHHAFRLVAHPPGFVIAAENGAARSCFAVYPDDSFAGDPMFYIDVSPAPEPKTSPSAATLNALAHQADGLKTAVYDASDADELNDVVQDIDFVAPLWDTLGYGYKTVELYKHVKVHATDLIAEDESFLAAERKNSKVRRITEDNLVNLKHLADYAGKQSK